MNPVVAALRTAASPRIRLSDLATQSCPCCRRKATSVSRYPAFVSKFFSGLLLAHCDNCGTGWVPIPNLDLDTYYEKHYAKEVRKDRLFEGKFYGPDNPVWSKEKHAVRDRAKRHADILHRIAPNAQDVLDIGCGEGYLLHNINVPRKFALESDENVQGILQEEVGATMIGQLPEKPTFDVIVASHVVEHFTYDTVRDYMLGFIAALKPNGVVLIEVPPGAWQLEEFAAGNRPPNQRLEPHTLFFSSYAMNMMLLDSGFEIVQSIRCPWTKNHMNDFKIKKQVPENVYNDADYVFVGRKPAGQTVWPGLVRKLRALT
ncbi:class I SAM-dependent methyltransferase [Parasedimentitalea huanghaiensis]|uniref:Methyltransferase domain-containing protein n=1 Tax=Parasedimentitalea huanghaiensis TaxID=2682100 RepID=A0A6L6WHG6_9RHOB|nr:class I SAM-dependent methyltransferase [Zongyanglinia huanghaiensis]MVO16688.1 methyltransferase domain-containing protein [Zongyanglinia huanghaiensis]